jgi:hypothetical protein
MFTLSAGQARQLHEDREIGSIHSSVITPHSALFTSPARIVSPYKGACLHDILKMRAALWAKMRISWMTEEKGKRIAPTWDSPSLCAIGGDG